MSNTIQLVSASALKTRLQTLGENSKANTLSLAYYTCVNGNVTPLKGCEQSITNLLDKTYRQFVCATFDKATGTWKYNKAKSEKLLKDKLNLTYNGCTFEEFVAAVDALEETKAAAAQAAKEAKEALEPEQVLAAEKEKVLAYLTRSNLTELQLKDLVLQVERERSKTAQKSIGLKSAA